MTVLLEVVSRELAMLVMMSGIGAGPVAFLSRDIRACVRWSLAPVVGLCLGTGVFTSINWFVPASSSYWFVAVLAAASVIVAALRNLRFRRDLRMSAAVVAVFQVVIIGVLVIGPTTYALVSHDSVGPGVYGVSDVDGYIASIDETVHTNLRVQAETWNEHKGPWANFVNERADFYAAGNQELDQTAFSANVDELLGYGASKTWDAFLLAILLAGALGSAAAVAFVTGRSFWIAAGSGALFGGAFFLQLLLDTSEGAICGLAVILPIMVVGAIALRSRRISDAVVLGILCSGLAGLYPLFVPVIVAVAICLAAYGLVYWLYRHRRPPFLCTERVMMRLVAVAVVSAGLDWDATIRDLGYLRSLLDSSGLMVGLPPYNLPGTALLGWLFQLQNLYSLSGPIYPGRIVLMFAVPLLVVATIVAALRRYPLALACVPILLMSFATAGYERTARDCSYCEGRSLLPAVPVLAFLAILGMVALYETRRPNLHRAAVALSLAFGGSLAYSAARQFQSLAVNSYYLTSAVRAAIAAIPSGHQVVELEGFNEGPEAPAEDALVYEAASESRWGQLSEPADYDENTALDYFTAPYPLPGPQFHKDYTVVLSRLGGVSTNRRVIIDSDGVELAERAEPLDVSVDYGLTAQFQYDDQAGYAWAWQPSVPIQFLVTGSSRATTSYVGARFGLPPSTVTVGPGPNVRESSAQGILTVCVRAHGTHGLGIADVHLNWSATPRLLSMAVSATHCPYAIASSSGSKP